MTKLETALSGAVKSELPPLPLVHVTVGRWMSAIVASAQLTPRHCDVMNRDLLYFSYGAPYYRPRNRQTQDALELPVVFVFSVELLTKISRFYPFDTGGVVKGVFGDKWKVDVSDLEDLYISQRPHRLVSCFYGSNPDYLSGHVAPSVPDVEPLPTVHSFLADDVSAVGGDQRQRTVECLLEHTVSLLSGLVWVGYPTSFAPEVQRLWEVCHAKFEFYSYLSDASENPASLVTHLSKVMREKFKYMHTPPVL